MKLRNLVAVFALALCPFSSLADEAAELQQMIDMLRSQEMPEAQLHQMEQQRGMGVQRSGFSCGSYKDMATSPGRL